MDKQIDKYKAKIPQKLEEYTQEAKKEIKEKLEKEYQKFQQSLEKFFKHSLEEALQEVPAEDRIYVKIFLQMGNEKITEEAKRWIFKKQIYSEKTSRETGKKNRAEDRSLAPRLSPKNKG